MNWQRLTLALCLACLIALLIAAPVYAQREWGAPILLASIITFIGQIVITSDVAIIFSQYRSGMSSAVARLRIAEAQSMTDSLTGLPNRRSFLNDAKTRRNGAAAMAVLVLDIDKIKTVNESRGYHAGDQVLTAFAEAVQGWLPGPPSGPSTDRWGGEEFALSIAMQTEAAIDTITR